MRIRERGALASASDYDLSPKPFESFSPLNEDSDDDEGDEVLVVVDIVKSLARDDFIDFQTKKTVQHNPHKFTLFKSFSKKFKSRK